MERQHRVSVCRQTQHQTRDQVFAAYQCIEGEERQDDCDPLAMHPISDDPVKAASPRPADDYSRAQPKYDGQEQPGGPQCPHQTRQAKDRQRGEHQCHDKEGDG